MWSGPAHGHQLRVTQKASSIISPQSSSIDHQSSIFNHQPSSISHQPSIINHHLSTINHQSINHQSINYQSINHDSRSTQDWHGRGGDAGGGGGGADLCAWGRIRRAVCRPAATTDALARSKADRNACRQAGQVYVLAAPLRVRK